ncbi:MAG: response regulator [Ignavibacteria bacterium]|nr:response regulator [Ignavibacteria bacterium]
MAALKVLVVEDDIINRRILVNMLKRNFGFEVLEAHDGFDGWEAILREKPDLVFLDIYLPIMNGVEIFDKIRKDFRFKNLPVIIYSSVNDKELIAKFIAKGISGYLLKPIDPVLLNERVVKFIEQIKVTSSGSKEVNT